VGDFERRFTRASDVSFALQQVEHQIDLAVWHDSQFGGGLIDSQRPVSADVSGKTLIY